MQGLDRGRTDGVPGRDPISRLGRCIFVKGCNADSGNGVGFGLASLLFFQDVSNNEYAAV